MLYQDEATPFAYKKSNNYFAKTFREINKTLELTEKEIRILIIFAILRIFDLLLNFIFLDKENSYYPIKILNCIILLISFIFSSAVYHNKDNVKQRSTMLTILFNFAFLLFDIISFILYFIFEVKNYILLFSLIINEIWLVKTTILIFKITVKFLKAIKNRKKK